MWPPNSADKGPMIPPGISHVARLCGLLAVAAVAMLLGIAGAEAETAIGPKSGLPVPRFVSLKPDRVNVRAGPTRDHDVAFVYTRAGLPVEITAESDNWRRIRDWEGQRDGSTTRSCPANGPRCWPRRTKRSSFPCTTEATATGRSLLNCRPEWWPR